MGNRKLVFPTPTLGSEPDSYHANVHYATVSALKTEGRGISYQACVSVLAEVMNHQLIAGISIRHWLQSYEEQVVDLSKFTIIIFHRGNGTALNTALVVGKTQLLRPTGNSRTYVTHILQRLSNIKFVSVEIAMDLEDKSKVTCECTFQTFFKLPIESRQTQTNPADGVVKDLTTFWGSDDLSLLSVDDFAAMVLLISCQVGAASLKQTGFRHD